ncbi:MAG: hypothetical protein JWL90_1653 [Chthoniobacteraceae bacterium]|nr:hypothetical protein [Chthoniobacteraceae bacterium]
MPRKRLEAAADCARRGLNRKSGCRDRNPGNYPVRPGAGLLLAEETPAGALFLFALLDLELSKKALETEVDLVPLRFHVVDGVGHIAQIPEGWSVGKERIDFILFRTLFFGARQNGFESLGDDAFDLKELVFVFPREFFIPCEVYVGVKLFPALDVILKVQDKVLEGLVMHGGGRVSAGEIEGGGAEKDERSSMELPGSNVKAAELDVKIAQRQMRRRCALKGVHDDTADFDYESRRKAAWERGSNDAAASMKTYATRGKQLRAQRLLRTCRGPHDSHLDSICFMVSRI